MRSQRAEHGRYYLMQYLIRRQQCSCLRQYPACHWRIQPVQGLLERTGQPSRGLALRLYRRHRLANRHALGDTQGDVACQSHLRGGIEPVRSSGALN